jgi:hypothetical protein
MWHTIKIIAVAEGHFQCEDSQGNEVTLPKYPTLAEMSAGEEINIFISKDKNGLIKKVLGKLISTND